MYTFVTNQEFTFISTTITGQLAARSTQKSGRHNADRLKKTLKKNSVRRRIIRYGLVAANVAVLGTVIGVVATTSHTSNSNAALAAESKTDAANPVDGLTSYDIAANVAKMTSLPEQTAINNQAQSAKVAVAVSSSDTSVAAKPQIVATALKSKDDIRTYTAVSGDTVASIAQKFGVTSDSIKWSNNLNSDTVALGAKLTIPPVNGIVYTVQSGDTVQSLATKFKANADQIISYNNAEISGIKQGEQVLIPNGQIQAPAAVRTASTASRLGGGSAIGFTPLYGNNGYDYGWCTWYVASMIAVPNNWGNASTWAYYAALSGWNVSSTPTPGAIAQTTSGNHVAIVNEVSADGSQIIYSDMNGIAGFARVGKSGWVPASHFEHYITH